MIGRIVVAGFLMTSIGSHGCAEYDAPPTAKILGVDQGMHSGSTDEDLVIEFSEPIKPDSLRIKVVTAAPGIDLNPENQLQDEWAEPAPLNILMEYGDGIATGADFSLNDSATRLSISKTESGASLGVANPYMVVIEPGLSDLNGNVTRPRSHLPFLFQSFEAGSTTMPEGAYYFLMVVDPPPLHQQLQLYVDIKVDTENGRFRAKFVAADRTPQMNGRDGCPSDCGDNACRLYPEPECVVPSFEQADINNWRDFKPFSELPDGYVFQTDGFAADTEDGKINIGTDPFDIDIVIGAGGINILAENVVFTGQMAPDPNEPSRYRGTGALSVEAVKINGVGEDPTKGTLELMTLTPEEQAEIEAMGNPYPVADPFTD